MRLDNALKELFDNYNDTYCIKSAIDINHGQYCIYKANDYPLMFARRKDDKIYPVISLNKHIESINFKISKIDAIDEKYIYEKYTKLISDKFIDNY